MLNPYRCRQCGAASYARLVHRRSDGAMGYTGRYRCSGCAMTFGDPVEWRLPARPDASSVQLRVRCDALLSSRHESGGSHTGPYAAPVPCCQRSPAALDFGPVKVDPA